MLALGPSSLPGPFWQLNGHFGDRRLVRLVPAEVRLVPKLDMSSQWLPTGDQAGCLADDSDWLHLSCRFGRPSARLAGSDEPSEPCRRPFRRAAGSRGASSLQEPTKAWFRAAPLRQRPSSCRQARASSSSGLGRAAECLQRWACCSLSCLAQQQGPTMRRQEDLWPSRLPARAG